MLVRFRQDVIDLHPKVVVILAGTNDIAGNTGPMRLEDIEADYASLAELARAHHIAVVFSSVLPVHNYTPKSQDFFAQRSPEKILALNHWLKDYCAASGLVYLDYFTAMVDDKGLMKRDLADDGLHPNPAGFKIMAPLAEAAIARRWRESPDLAQRFASSIYNKGRVSDRPSLWAYPGCGGEGRFSLRPLRLFAPFAVKSF